MAAKYSRLPSNEVSVPSSPEPRDSTSTVTLFPAGPARRQWLTRGIYLIACCFLVAFVFATGYYTGREFPTEKTCAYKTSLFSPANEAIEYTEYYFDNDFAAETKFRGPPTEELEKEWADIWEWGEVSYPEDKIGLLDVGREPRTWKLISPDRGGGYAVGISVFHQLHCLNYIRQYTWGDYYQRHNMAVPLQSNAVGQRMHVDHCIEELRKTLMCHGDTTPFLLEIDPDAPVGERSDFSARHKCRDFRKLQLWMEDHVISWW